MAQVTDLRDPGGTPDDSWTDITLKPKDSALRVIEFAFAQLRVKIMKNKPRNLRRSVGDVRNANSWKSQKSSIFIKKWRFPEVIYHLKNQHLHVHMVAILSHNKVWWYLNVSVVVKLLTDVQFKRMINFRWPRSQIFATPGGRPMTTEPMADRR